MNFSLPRLFLCFALAGIVLSPCMAQVDSTPNLKQDSAPATKTSDRSLEQKACFLIGFNFGTELTAQMVNVDTAEFMAGMKAAISGEKINMTDEEMNAVMTAFAKEIQGRLSKKMEELAAKNAQIGEEFLKGNAAKEGVTKLENGIQCRVIKPGPGTGENPTGENIVKVHYTGKLINGEVFDSSIGGDPAEFAVSGLIRGLTEGIKKMKVGDKYEIVVPSDLGYGAQGNQGIGPNEVLIFEIDLLEIVK